MESERELSSGESMSALERWFEQRMRQINATGTVAEGRTTVGATMAGKVRRVLVEKQFGFIRDEQGVDRFFHRDQTLANFDALKEGDAVRFRPVENPKKGPRAEDVDLADDAGQAEAR
jgi:cold shock CspA family protein